MSNILREYIQLALNERIRSQGKFNLNQFKELEEPFMQVAFVDGVLEELGRGTSRWTYLLTSGKVLKIASPHNEDKGRAQNEAEVQISSNPRLKQLVARVFDYHPNYDWLISELVRPLTSNEMRRILGYSIDNLFNFALDAFDKNMTIDEFLASKPKIAKLVPPKARQFVTNCIELIDSTELAGGDISRAEHWGKTPDGRIVLLDYGLTHQIYDTHYKHEFHNSSTATPE